MPATIGRDLDPSKRPKTGGWTMRISDCPHPVEQRARKLQRNPLSNDSSGLDRRDGGTVLSSPRGQRRWLERWRRYTARKPNKSIRSFRRNCARHLKLKLQLTWRVTRMECCESIFLRLAEVTEKRSYLLIWKNFTNRDFWIKSKTRTTKPRQHGLCQNGKCGSCSDNTVTWDIHSQRGWLVHYGTQEQGAKLCGLFSESCVAQGAKHDLYRCHPVQECYHAVYVLTSGLEVRGGTSAKALNVVCWSTVLHIVQPLWTNYTAKTVMKEFKIACVKHYGWPEIVVHDQGPEFLGNEFQNPELQVS